MSKNISPMLADNWVQSKVKFPCIVEPKSDGVRGFGVNAIFTGRSMETLANLKLTAFYSQPRFRGIDCELYVGSDISSPSLCRDTTSCCTTITGEVPNATLFDYITPQTIELGYMARLEALSRFHERLYEEDKQKVQLTKWAIVHNMDELEEADEINLNLGMEGTIGRSMDGKYKQGRSTANEGGLWRIKRFVEEDAVVLQVIEGKRNLNEAEEGADGYTKRSTHAENMVPNGKLGSMICRDVKTGKEILVGAGAMTHAMRVYYFLNPEKIIGQTIKYRNFPKGVKNKPRFPTYHSHRAKADIVDIPALACEGRILRIARRSIVVAPSDAVKRVSRTRLR